MKTLPCPPEHWPEFSRLLDEAFELPATDRQAWLGQLATQHAHLKPWLAGVLNADAQMRTGNFLDRPHFPTVAEGDFAFEAGQPVGPYRLEEPLGRGGMGEVWKARRIDGALDRNVALKLPHFWIFASGMRQRLHRERDILASLTHPHIAQLHDAGVTGDGQPYLALELVPGEPIDDYCRKKGLTVEQRVVLFGQVLEAIRYAHSQLVVHRDLKPSNILVTTDGQVKLLDFGIAKLLDAGGDGSATELTRLAGRALTPEYAAPEQIAGEPVSVATDVFALGVVLFQLVTGRRPFGRERPVDVPIASASIHPEHIEDVRCANVRELRRQLEGDLDAILARCLAPAPADRYASVEQLAEDLGRHLRLEPIRARRIGKMERTLRFVRRHRLAVGMGTALAVVLASGITGIVLQTLRAEQAADQARSEARRADLTKNFLFDLLIANDTRIPANQPRDRVAAGDLLAYGIDHIAADYAGDVDAQITLKGLVATIYNFWGHGDRRMELLRERAQLAEKTYGRLHPAVIETMIETAYEQHVKGDAEDAWRTLADADERLRAARLDDSYLRARWWESRYYLLPRTPATLDQRVAALENLVRINAGRTEDMTVTVLAYTLLANLYRDAGRSSDARDAAEQGLRLSALEPRVYKRSTVSAPLNRMLALSLGDLGDLEGAESAWARAEIPQNDRVPGLPDDSLVIPAHHAFFVAKQGDRAHTARLLDGILERAKAGTTSSVELLAIQQFIGYCQAIEGRHAEAFETLSAIRDDFLANFPGERVEFLHMLGDAADGAGHADIASRAFDEAMAFAREDYPATSRWVVAARERRDRFLLEHGRVADARADLLALAALQKAQDPAPVALAHGDLARIALIEGDTAAAATSIDRAIAALESTRMLHDVRDAAYLWRVRAAVLQAFGDEADARQWQARALEASRRTDDPSSPAVHADVPAKDAAAPLPH